VNRGTPKTEKMKVFGACTKWRASVESPDQLQGRKTGNGKYAFAGSVFSTKGPKELDQGEGDGPGRNGEVGDGRRVMSAFFASSSYSVGRSYVSM